ncbi:response regulator transcription factor [Anabaena cylindrica UHCC 0172]|uniref:response regulator transcription factor n=1 Tax=Anabaena cylindrica TaxID=1165 RepID=UPI002B21B701|nr:response regulator transcription factor [Anabaena cylindrica]MEA5552817.1 response regulator transcription factor [Anabaena cylindrica UHCC 0172]
MENLDLLASLSSQNPAYHAKKSILANSYVSIVSNSHLLREAITLLLQPYEFIDVDNNYTDSISIVPTITTAAKHLVLIDNGIGQNATRTKIQEWRSLEPSPYVVVVELKNEIDLILDCIEAGAHGYTLQGASSLEIIQLIEQVYQGTTQCSPEVTTKLFERLAQPIPVEKSPAKPSLTRREQEVLHCLTKNYSDREIAMELFVEVRTVKHHVHNILRKFKVKHRWDAAKLALQNSWLDISSASN